MKYTPTLLKKWISLYKEVNLISKLTLVLLSLTSLIGFIGISIKLPYTLCVTIPILVSYELTKR